MENVYLKFTDPSSEQKQTNSRIKKALQGLFTKVLSTVIPKANPDFDGLIENVKEWLLEINVATDTVNREIGISESGQILMIMPMHDNYGYWSDNEIGLDYFKEHFKAIEIERKEFDDKWKDFISQKSIPENYEFDKRGFSKYYRFLEQSGWDYDGYMTFTKGDNRILFDTSECFYIERPDHTRVEFQCKNMEHFKRVVENNTSKKHQ